MQKGIIIHTLIYDDKGKILLLRRSSSENVLPGYWDLPGGTLEDGEDPEAGAIRETKEETGLSVSSLRLFFQQSNIDVEKNKQFIRLSFHVRFNAGKIVLNPKEHDTYVWIEPADISKYKVLSYFNDCIKAFLQLKNLEIK